MERPLSWLPEAPNSLGTNDIIEIQQSGSAMRHKMYVADLVTGMYDKLFPKISGNKNAIELIEDRLTALDDEATGDVTLVKATVGDESEGLVKSVAANTNALANTMKPTTPIAATDKASLVLPGAVEGTINFITIEAVTAGIVGNSISITVDGLGGISHPLELKIDGSEITIILETDESGDPISTLADITDAITNDSNQSYNAGVSALITARDSGTGTIELGASSTLFLSGGANNGTGAAKGATMFDDNYIYIAIDDCDGSADTSNWKKIALAAFDAE